MLSDIVSAAMKRFGKWYSSPTGREDLEQEAWVAALEAQEAGIIDPDDIQRLIENHLTNFYRREHRPPGEYPDNGIEEPMTNEELQREESLKALRGRGMSRVRSEELLRQTEGDPD